MKTVTVEVLSGCVVNRAVRKAGDIVENVLYHDARNLESGPQPNARIVDEVEVHDTPESVAAVTAAQAADAAAVAAEAEAAKQEAAGASDAGSKK